LLGSPPALRRYSIIAPERHAANVRLRVRFGVSALHRQTARPIAPPHCAPSVGTQSRVLVRRGRVRARRSCPAHGRSSILSPRSSVAARAGAPCALCPRPRPKTRRRGRAELGECVSWCLAVRLGGMMPSNEPCAATFSSGDWNGRGREASTGSPPHVTSRWVRRLARPLVLAGDHS